MDGTKGQRVSLPFELRPLLAQAESAYAAWVASRDDVSEEAGAVASEAAVAQALELFVAGALKAGMDSDRVLAALRRRFPEAGGEPFFEDAISPDADARAAVAHRVATGPGTPDWVDQGVDKAGATSASIGHTAPGLNTKLLNLAVALVIVCAVAFLALWAVPALTQKAGGNLSNAANAIVQVGQAADETSIINMVKNDSRINTVLSFAPSRYHDIKYAVTFVDGYTSDNGMAYATCSITFKNYQEGPGSMGVPILKNDAGLRVGDTVVWNGDVKILDKLAAEHSQP